MRCPACSYSYGPREGAPESFDGVFTKDVVCPECAFVVPEGSRVVVGSSTAYSVGARASFSMLLAFGVLVLIGALVWLPDVVRGLFGSTPGPTSNWLGTISSLGALVMVGLLALTGYRMREARKQQSASADATRAEDAILVARAMLFAPGWLVVFDRSNRWGAPECIDARLVRSVRVRECAAGKDGLTAGHEVSAWLLPPGPPAAPPVFVRADIDAAFAAELDASLRLPPRTDLADQVAAWAKATALPVRRPRTRRPTAASGLEADGRQREAFEVLDGGRAVVLRGSPKDPAEIPYEGYSRAYSAIMLAPIISMTVPLVFMLFGSGVRLPVAVGFTVCMGLPMLAVTLVPSLRKRRACAAVSEWYIARNGIEIVRGRSRERRPASAAEAIELHRPSGVPQLVIAGDRSLFGKEKLIPHNWGGRSPEEVVEAIRAVLRAEAPGLGGTGIEAPQ